VAVAARASRSSAAQLRISKALIDLQGKAQEILGLALPRIDESSTEDSPNSFNSAHKRSR
jgi:hypothetical protein